MNQAIRTLLSSIHDEILGWDWDADPDERGPDLRAKYFAEIESLGRTKVLRNVILAYTASMGPTLLLHLHFVWENMPYSEWLDVLAQEPLIGEMEVQYFRAFYGEYLGIDFEAAVRGSDLPQQLKDRLAPAGRRPSGGPTWGHVEDVFEGLGLDPFLFWRRLASEGAPMLVSEDDLQRGYRDET